MIDIVEFAAHMNSRATVICADDTLDLFDRQLNAAIVFLLFYPTVAMLLNATN